jgi:hypothetical protein
MLDSFEDSRADLRMTPRWLTIEKLVAELGGICTSQYELCERTGTDAPSDQDLKEAVARATSAVGAVLGDPAGADDDVVLTAWHAIARAQDVIGRLQETVRHARALRDRAQWLQQESLQLRHQVEADAMGTRRARRRSDRG